MQHIGITGGIGSGKTTVCNIFKLLNVPIYNSDERAKWLINNKLADKICKAFGDDIFDNNVLNRALLAERAFANTQSTAILNNIVHPAVAKDYADWKSQQKAIYTLKEAALLIESGSYKNLNKLIVVIAPEKIRIDRTLKRGGITLKDIKARIKKQLTDEDRKQYADYIIENDGSKSLIKQVLAIHQSIITDATI